MLGLHQRTRIVVLSTREERLESRKADEELSESMPDLSIRAVPIREQPEYESPDALAEYLFEDERTEFTTAELVAVASRARKSSHEVRTALESYGLRLVANPRKREVRGFTSNPHNRYAGTGNGGGGSGIDPSTPGLRFGSR